MSTTTIPTTLGATQEAIVVDKNDLCATEKGFTDVRRHKTTAQLVDWVESAVETNGETRGDFHA